jgi:hypothetical protein
LAGFAASAAIADPPPAEDQPQAQPPPPAHAPSQPRKPDPSQVVSCRDEDVGGSMLNRKRVCKTKRQWDEQAQQTQSEVFGQPHGPR